MPFSCTLIFAKKLGILVCICSIHVIFISFAADI